MTFDEILAHILALLQREQRVSYRALKRRFDLDDLRASSAAVRRIISTALSIR